MGFTLFIPNSYIVKENKSGSLRTMSSRSDTILFGTTEDGWYDITLVGGGGGGRGGVRSGVGGKSNWTSSAGGSGAAFIGQIYLIAGKRYKVTVGTGGAKKYTQDKDKEESKRTYSKAGGDTSIEEYDNSSWVKILTCNGGGGASCASWYPKQLGKGGAYSYISNSSGITTTSDGKNTKHSMSGINISGNKIKGKLVSGNNGMFGIRHGGGKGETEWYHSYSFSAYYGLIENNGHYNSSGWKEVEKGEWGHKAYYSWLKNDSTKWKKYITCKDQSANKDFLGSVDYGAGGSAWSDNNDNNGDDTSNKGCYDGKNGYASVSYKQGTLIQTYDYKVLRKDSTFYIGYAYGNNIRF